ncbi:MAG: hypothetical protein PUB46_07465 [Lachnospiraceae bacterium]|uniref:hypothetical protein n=1 Tax=Roseburia hominis TaxID=301301 RepID=UPI001F2B11F7|nr:hypothetical protein [Roseburia hominis]MCI5713716.1 hypothetical protein [Lachnospiraceae bacterium]MDD6169902.1 hypothetical protein [Lachnospiraceae bacterium]MDY4839109.1 hypothetical protein [Lachnospiraceae bacterium]
MDVNAINTISASQTETVKRQTPVTETKNEEAKQTTDTKKVTESKKQEDSGVIYEKTSSDGYYSIKNAGLIEQLKADTESRILSLRDIVNQMITKQGNTLAKADDIWSFLASGDYTVDEAAKKKAQEEISEDGYWGVKQTSDRILDFAKALSGNDVSKADLLLDAFKKGFAEATKTWGKELPDISQKTYDAVLEKFDAWKQEANTSASATTDSQTGNDTATTSEVVKAQQIIEQNKE